MCKSFNLSKQFKHLPLYVNTEQFIPNKVHSFKGSPFGLVLYFEPLFLIPSQAAARCQGEKGVSPPDWGRMGRHMVGKRWNLPARNCGHHCQDAAYENGKIFPLYTRKGKLVSVNSVFYLQGRELLQKRPAKLTELVVLILPAQNPGLLPVPQEVK